MSKENRLIDANALELATFTVTQESEYARGWNDALNIVRITAPTADAGGLAGDARGAGVVGRGRPR